MQCQEDARATKGPKTGADPLRERKATKANPITLSATQTRGQAFSSRQNSLAHTRCRPTSTRFQIPPRTNHPRTDAASRGVTIKLFPHQSTPKARDFAGGVEKTYINDIQAIASYLAARPCVIPTLKNFEPVSPEEYRANKESGSLDKDALSEDINQHRTKLFLWLSKAW